MATPTTLPATFVAGNVLTAAQMNNLRGAFRVLQVVSTTKTDTFTTNSTTPVDVTGLSVTITPSSTSSKILILASVPWSAGNGNYVSAFMRLDGGGTTNYRGNANSNAQRCVTGIMELNNAAYNYQTVTAHLNYLDSPATTSATTYKAQIWLYSTGVASPNIYVNRPAFNATDLYASAAAATITAMEISA